jgi:hypothetical protein
MAALKQTQNILNINSLAETLRNLESVRLGFSTAKRAEVDRTLDWILGRQGLEGSYKVTEKFGLFALAPDDLPGAYLMTGEKLPPAASNRHILGQEALRALALWNRLDTDNAQNGLHALNCILDINRKRTGEKITPVRFSGQFCCTKCTLALLRTVSAVKSLDWEKTLSGGIQSITATRDGKGRWNRLPYYYTLLTLSNCDVPSAKNELEYASSSALRLISRYQQKTDLASQFRLYLLTTALSTSRSS